MSRLLIISATFGAILSVAACSPAEVVDESARAKEPVSTATAPTQEAEPATFDVAGALVMEGPMATGRSSDHEAGGMCVSLRSGVSFSDDHQLLLLDGAGDVVALGKLGEFTFTEAEDTNTCMRRFTIDDVPTGNFFKLKFGDNTSDVVDMDYLADQEVAWTFR